MIGARSLVPLGISADPCEELGVGKVCDSDKTQRLRFRVSHSKLDPDTLLFTNMISWERGRGLVPLRDPEKKRPVSEGIFFVR